jgi:disulfide bond formation protein DsbB
MVFGLLARKNKKPVWLAVGFFVMACIALIGGLAIAYRQLQLTTSPSVSSGVNSNVTQPAPSPTMINQQASKEINQESHGNGAVNAVVQGQVTVTNGPTTEHPSKPKQEQRKK